MKILVKNGTIVSSTDTYKSDILINGSKIERIEFQINTHNIDKVIDASGYYIFPGGIDPHVHMHLPTPAGYSSDDFFSGSRAALFGGTTTLLDFVTPEKGQSLTEALNKRKDEAKNSIADYSFHVSPIEWRDSTEQEIRDCVNEGITSFKVYMAYKETVGLNNCDLINVMRAVGGAGGMVTVHCESGDDIEILRKRSYKENHTGPEYHYLSRPPELEASAVKEAIYTADLVKCNLYIVHVSAAESLKHIEDALLRGQKVIAETCPQYLLLNDSRYQGDFKSMAPYIISPPLRRPEDNKSLWMATNKGIIKTIGTDHCPFNISQKVAGINDFRKIPNGAGGIEHRIELLYTYGVLENQITLNQMVDLVSTQPAIVFGLYPSKGEIMVDSDADITIWNPASENTISVKTHHQNCDNNIYEGIKIKGCAEHVIARGEVIIENRIMVNSESRGKFLRR